ncbi:MAG: DUF4974 domain-containing protein [Candidatus Pseudobacter hemicellulosilyticus]|uniref:DUF4974 domain-containing protein n=1 Tax=Candidatus Pseudobacter hemicellulosilyticus TaxID=3121375 RepID=A0AAJ5WY14_9BACT|nr:MAG: DUF4974 domain-containing protein [Pseudobacter sp.]
MDNNRFHYLLEEYILNRLDKEKAAELLHLLDQQPVARELEELVYQQLGEQVYDQEVELPLTRQKIISGLEAAIADGKRTGFIPVRRIPILSRFRWAAAASILLLAAGGGWWLLSNRPAKPVVQNVVAVHDVNPGREGAQLKLSDNRIILVDTAREGLIAMDGKIAIYKENGRIVYKGSADQVIYNEMVTDKGRQYSTTLPDGSVVWLNAMSSIRYPLHFAGTERAVTLTGEGKFKVTQKEGMPFRVYIRNAGGDGGMVEGGSTEFNINAYSDELVIKTSVATGSVAVHNAAPAGANAAPGLSLRAGQQAQMDRNGIKIVNDADINQAMAWAQGVFSFNGETLEGVMRQLARWYDVEVVYEEKPGNVHFGGEIAMNQTLSQVLEGLSSMKINFRIENKRIVVMP